ncbi:MAG: aminotransferase class V-fold PLP-dependent enzyme [Oleibacter sp.]|nr:aminotransferase class V-fold PLP-dependent enzyme [Thalassolituus sp.]
MTPIYLDYAATTPCAPEVAEKMAQCLTLDGFFGNPASRSHKYGWLAENQVEIARGHLATLINADPREIVWTSGATESNNLAIKGVIEALRQQQPDVPLHIITSAIEHKAVLDAVEHLRRWHGVEVTLLNPDSNGLIHPQQVSDALRPETCLVSLMAVNNEIGTITDIAAIAQLLSSHRALLHVDAAQAIGKIVVDTKAWQVDLMSISAHKFYGPKGIGALYVRREPKVAVTAQLHGGGHERGMRSGTLPTHQIVGLGEAARLVSEHLEEDESRIRRLRDGLWQTLNELPDIHLNGDLTQRVANHLNVSFAGVDGEVLLSSLAKVALSSGSACNSVSVEPSFVLTALGLNRDMAHAGLRISLGRYTTDEDVDRAGAEILRVVRALRER